MKRLDALPDEREVHVWFVELAASPASAEACFRTLSAQERERRGRFRFEHLRAAFTLSRGILRALLGRYLAVPPERLRFIYGPRGKPRLAFPETRLEFNLAHSGRFVAYAFAVGCAVGVDIEEVRPARHHEDIVHRFFSSEEREEWLRLDPSRRDEAFLRCWTAKEAYAKALGHGLAMLLDSVRASLKAWAPPPLVPAPGEPAAAGQWSLCALAPAAGYVGSLAVGERGRSVRVSPPLTAGAVLELVSGTGAFPPAP